MMNLQKILNITVALLAVTLYGCSSDSSSTSATMGTSGTTASTSASYEIIITNLTGAQPVAPVAVVLHTSGYSAGNVGTSASVALEKLAEGGDNAMLLSEANANASVLTSMGGAGVLMPAASETITASVSDNAGLQISLAGMLVNTNDGFAAVSGLDISALTVGGSQTVFLPVFDAGTEANVETATSMPGTGGTGFDAARNDTGFISVHRGVVTADDGLATSGLNASHRFDNPALKVVILRIS
jgi:membrane-associated HD superfamily phosphohydrolase